MNKITRLFAAAMLATGMAAACTDLNDLEKRVESLESRVTALETLIPNLNSNIEALQVLVSGTTINSATESNGVWTLVLSNGQTITLTAGSIGVGNAPVMSVDKDGYWMVDYGQGAEYILSNGEKVKALGTDGKTPVFGVDAEGYWTVSYDGGTTFTQVKDADGQPVSALPTGEVQDSYFADVKFENGVFTVTLRTGEVLNIPVIPDFLCAIESTGVLTYNYAETKPYNVTMKSVGSTMITAPYGWTAVLNGNVLSVTAPAAPTKAILADSGSDVCILAFAATGSAATIAKVQVRLADSPVVEIKPTASVTAGNATETTLTYSVALSDATSYKYIHQKESETAPDAAKIAAEGTESTETSLTISELDNATTYSLYVLPINGEKQGAVASGKNTTLNKTYSNIYEKYMDGMDIELGSITINKNKYGDAVLINNESENKTLSHTGVYFIDPNTENVLIQSAEKLVIVSLNDKKATVSKAGQATVTPTENDDYFIMHNIKYVTGMTSGNIFGGSKVETVFESIIFSNCQFEVPKDMSLMYAQLPIDNFIVRDCDIKLHATTADKNLLATNTASTYKSVIFTNNIIYCTDGNAVNYKVFNNANATIANLEFKNNTLAAVYPKDTNGFIHVKAITTASIETNLFYLPEYSSTNAKYSGIIWMPQNTSETGIAFTKNLAFYKYDKVPSTRMKCSFYRNDATGEIYNKASTDNPIPSPDYVNGVFVQGENYVSYGAKR